MDETQLVNWDPEEEKEEVEEEELRVSDREPRGRLRVFAGNQRPETGFMVYRGENVIGRHESCHIHIPVQSVSKKHAVIEIDGDSHLIHDCNSLNKTRRKNAILKPNVRYTINDGDLFLFADVACQYLLLAPPAKDVDSGSETGSESMFPQLRPGAGTDQREARPESDEAAIDDAVPEAADSDLESPEDSLILSPTQPYQPKSSMPLPVQLVQSDTYVKESEDDDTPWKRTASFTSRDGQEPNASIRQTPSANVVPESDDEGGDSSHPNIPSVQLHYDSDTDLEEDQHPSEKRTEPSNGQPVHGNNVSCKTGGIEEQETDKTPPATGGSAISHLNVAEEVANDHSGDALDHDEGRVTSREPDIPPTAGILPHFSRDSDSDVEEEQNSATSSSGPTARTKMGSSLVDGADADVQGADAAATSGGSLITPGEEGGSSKVDHYADTEGETKETPDSVDKREFLDVNSDTDIDEAGVAAGAASEEESTQLFACHSPTFNKEPFKGGAAAANSTEEEATQLFNFQSPTFGKDPFKGGAAATNSTEEEATQLFNFQSPTFGKDSIKSGAAAANSTEEEATQLFTFQPPTFGKDPFKEPFTSGFDRSSQLGNAKAAPQHQDPSETGEEEAAESNREDQWAVEDTQPFCLQNEASEVEQSVKPEEVTQAFIAQGMIPASCAEDCPAPTSEDQPDTPAKTRRRSVTEDASEVESKTIPPAPTDQPVASKGRERDSSQQANKEMNSRAPEEQHTTEASKRANRVHSGDATVASAVQMAEAAPSNSGGETADPPVEERSSETPAPKRPPIRRSGRRTRRRPTVGPAPEAETNTGQEDPSVPGDQSQRRDSGSEPGAGDGRKTRGQRRKALALGTEAAGEDTGTPVDRTEARPKRGRGRKPKTVSVSTTDEDRGPLPEEEHGPPPEEERPEVPTIRGRSAKRRSVAAPQSQDGNVEITPPTDSLAQKRPAGRGRRKQEFTQPASQETGLSSGRKRRTRAASPSDGEKETSTPPQVKTCRRASRLSSPSLGSLPDSVAPPKIMFTGLVDENGEKVIKQLGGEMVESVHDSTHLVTDRIRRTVKFLCAVARGIPVVTPEWLKKCGKSRSFLPTSSFLVDDSNQEQNFNFKLAESLQKAKEQPLLKDYRVHVTAGVQPEPSQMESILQCSGASVLPKMPRAYKEKTLVISCPADLLKCKPALDAGIPVVNAEFLLTGILQQTVDLVRYRLDGEGDVDSKPEGKGRKRSSTAAATQPARGKKKKH
ncbi:mediator of DNA damage checkpoint protein 1 isoform X2 [Heptranchias perlo]|uniref:mediator of DNA damage checkpoint protein 1 isoform X2 n=1 Tax=Heptranchias perlo TaxID=212740 RepID=UPI003559E102